MTEVNSGAASHNVGGWHRIDWANAHSEVCRLQARIVKAAKEGKWGKVNALQHTLTSSFSAKALAVRRVTENRGKRTPGVDGETWSTPEAKLKAIGTLTRRGYRPKPLKRVYIEKANGKKRPLGIPTMKDRAMQALHLLALDPIAELTADKNSFGFRPRRSTADAIARCFSVLSRRTSPKWVLEADIRGCFDHISHEWLIANVPMDKRILQQWLEAGVVESNTLHDTTEGTPQGGIISPVLANLALDGLEKAIEDKFPKTGKGCGKGRSHALNVVRYADDFIITGASKEILEEEVMPIVKEFLTKRGLELSSEKTKVTHIDDGFDFLGFNLRKYNGKLLIKPATKSVISFLKDIRTVLRENMTAPAGHIIVALNRKIRGWANYYQHVVSKDTFKKVDHHIFQALWRWCKRRHPMKNITWIKNKYFPTLGTREWVFQGVTTDRRGDQIPTSLMLASDTKIRRHVQILAHANPYDPEFETYFERRNRDKWKASHNGKLLRIFMTQEGKCAHCGLAIDFFGLWDIHHVQRVKDKGDDKMSNLRLAHLTCHKAIHSKQGDYSLIDSKEGQLEVA